MISHRWVLELLSLPNCYILKQKLLHDMHYFRLYRRKWKVLDSEYARGCSILSATWNTYPQTENLSRSVLLLHIKLFQLQQIVPDCRVYLTFFWWMILRRKTTLQNIRRNEGGTNGMKMQTMCRHYRHQRELQQSLCLSWKKAMEGKEGKQIKHQEKGKKRQHRELKIRKEDGDNRKLKKLKEIQHQEDRKKIQHRQLKVRKEDDRERMLKLLFSLWRAPNLWINECDAQGHSMIALEGIIV